MQFDDNANRSHFKRPLNVKGIFPVISEIFTESLRKTGLS